MVNRVFLSRLVRVAFAAVCGAIWAASALAAATVQITDIPVYGETGTLKGRVSGDIDFAAHKVAIFIHIDGIGWWTKPTFASPSVPINTDGTFSAELGTSGEDARATIYSAILVRSEIVVPLVGNARSLPVVEGALASDSRIRYSRTVDFSGYVWGVKESRVMVGPGKNFFSNLANDVWVDGLGQLHLTLSNHDGNWWATEVIAQGRFGYGKYIFQTNSRVDQLDQSVTFGGYTYDAFGGSAVASVNREIDIEDSRWGVAQINNSQFVVQPFDAPGHLTRYAVSGLSTAPALTRMIDWHPNGIRFLATRGHHLPGDNTSGDVIADWSYVGATPSPGRAVPRLNLWANNVELKGPPPAAPASGLPQEVIVSKFVFQPANPRDFDGDGKSDIGWQDTASGQRALWLMDGGTLKKSVGLGAVHTDWKIVGTGDFNGDGQTDLLWQNTVSGAVVVWFMNGTDLQGSASIGPTIPVRYQIDGVGDFNGDGSPDIFWTDTTTGDRYIWLMNGTTLSSSVYTGKVAVSWQVVGTGDFNADGRSDILWQDTTTGQLVLWFMDGARLLGSTGGLGPIIPIQYHVSGVGDFNGDGQPDILWTDTTTGNRYVWLMNGATLARSVFLANVPTNWSIVR